MRAISWIFTVMAIAAIGACFADEAWLFAAGPLAILAEWTDKIAIDHELSNWRSKP